MDLSGSNISSVSCTAIGGILIYFGYHIFKRLVTNFLWSCGLEAIFELYVRKIGGVRYTPNIQVRLGLGLGVSNSLYII